LRAEQNPRLRSITLSTPGCDEIDQFGNRGKPRDDQRRRRRDQIVPHHRPHPRARVVDRKLVGRRPVAVRQHLHHIAVWIDREQVGLPLPFVATWTSTGPPRTHRRARSERSACTLARPPPATMPASTPTSDRHSPVPVGDTVGLQYAL